MHTPFELQRNVRSTSHVLLTGPEMLAGSLRTFVVHASEEQSDNVRSTESKVPFKLVNTTIFGGLFVFGPLQVAGEGWKSVRWNLDLGTIRLATCCLYSCELVSDGAVLSKLEL